MEVSKPMLGVLLALIFGSNAVLADILVFSLRDQHQIEGEFRDMPAKFGSPVPPDGLKGMVVYADPPNACGEIKKPPNNTDLPNYTDTWIVLAARYNCTFDIKVRMAQKAGYDAIIVHNVNSNELEPMSTRNPYGLIIPAVFVSEITGLIIRESYLYNKLYFILINDDLPFNINTHLLLPFAIVVGICFLVMVIFMIVKCIKNRRRQRRHRLPNSSLKKIPTHKFTNGDPYETCAICLEDYVEGEKLRVLPCAHVYHSKCIDPWLTKNRRVCPCCKRKVYAADERVVTDSESDSEVDDATPLIRNGHSGTQGGTFTPQRENPFMQSERRSRQRWNSETSGSSYESVRSNLPFDDNESYNNEDITTPLLRVSDNHSINGETSDIERSVSSTKPHTVTLFYDGHEHTLPIFRVTDNVARSSSSAPSTVTPTRSSTRILK